MGRRLEQRRFRSRFLPIRHSFASHSTSSNRLLSSITLEQSMVELPAADNLARKKAAPTSFLAKSPSQSLAVNLRLICRPLYAKTCSPGLLTQTVTRANQVEEDPEANVLLRAVKLCMGVQISSF